MSRNNTSDGPVKKRAPSPGLLMMQEILAEIVGAAEAERIMEHAAAHRRRSPKVEKAQKSIHELAAEAEAALKAMDLDAHVSIFDKRVRCDDIFCLDGDCDCLKTVQLTDLPELLADPIGFAQRRFGRTSADVIPFKA
jgi:hypothetical protein